MQDDQLLSIIALGNHDLGFLKELSALFAQHPCGIIHSHVISHSLLSHVNFLIRAKWSVLAKLESRLKSLAKKFSFELYLKQTNINPSPAAENSPALAYTLYIISLASTSNFHQLMQFLYHSKVQVTEILTETYQTRRTQTDMSAFTVKIILDTHTSISDWRESFMLFCDDLNMDAIMEPDKG